MKKTEYIQTPSPPNKHTSESKIKPSPSQFSNNYDNSIMKLPGQKVGGGDNYMLSFNPSSQSSPMIAKNDQE